MNNLSLPALFALVAVLGGQGRASDLVAFPKGSSAWTVDVTASPSASDASSTGGSAPKDTTHVVKLDVIQDNQKRRVEVTLANGNTSEKWIIATTNVVLVKDPNGTVLGYPNSGDSGLIFGAPFLESSFSWIKPRLLVEKDPISYDGKQCYHYKGTVPTVFPRYLHAPEHTTHVVEAWIDSTTDLPVAVDDSTWLATYTFHPPPYPTLTIPPEFQKTFDRLSR